MKVTWTYDPRQTRLPDGFIYVGQDSYYLTSHHDSSPCYLYSDSATSCVILILEGRDRNNLPLVALTHLSCYERFQAFFERVDQHFSGGVSVFTLGANPPSAVQSQYNSQTVLHWILTHTPLREGQTLAEADWYVDQMTLALGFRLPEKERSGCAGIDVQTRNVSTQAYALTEIQRDQTGGVQTLFSLFGLYVKPAMVLHNVAETFSEDEVKQLVHEAERANWTVLLEMTDDQILASCSSTPDDEVPWFCESLRNSARYVKWGDGMVE